MGKKHWKYCKKAREKGEEQTAGKIDLLQQRLKGLQMKLIVAYSI